MPEPKIQIDDHVLTEGQAMALRVAISNFFAELDDDVYRLALGPIGEAYRDRITEIVHLYIKRGDNAGRR